MRCGPISSSFAKRAATKWLRQRAKDRSARFETRLNHENFGKEMGSSSPAFLTTAQPRHGQIQ
jgi:hypothetical protein